jgi:hypothetical protein
MGATKSFKDLVQSRVAHDHDFEAALLRDGIDTMLAGDVDNPQGNGSASAARRYARLVRDILRIT